MHACKARSFQWNIGQTMNGRGVEAEEAATKGNMRVWVNGSEAPLPTRKLPLWSTAALPVDLSTQSTLLVTAFLRASAAGHSGSFATASNLLKHISLFVRRSPGLCNLSMVHVVHDQEKYRPNASYLGVNLHYFPNGGVMPPGDARWAMFASVLQGFDDDDNAWRCAWLVDMTDVDVLRLPPCSKQFYGHAGLAVGTDACALRPTWLRETAIRGNYSVSSPALQAFFHGQHAGRKQTLNCGLVGGLRDAILTAVEQMSRRLARHHLVVPPPPYVPMDMVVLNQLALELEAVNGPLVTGYPLGPVNLPMWGGLTDRTQFCARHTDPWGGSSTCEHECRLVWVNATVGHYMFGHKLKMWWTRFNAEELHRGGKRSSCPPIPSAGWRERM